MASAHHDAPPSTSEVGSSAIRLVEDQLSKVTLQEASSQSSSTTTTTRAEDITYRNYKDEDDIDVITALVAPSLSEPYSVYCYRYFLHGW